MAVMSLHFFTKVSLNAHLNENERGGGLPFLLDLFSYPVFP